MTNIDIIAELFPECITESRDSNGKLQRAINFVVLKDILEDNISADIEKYSFTWVGKNQVPFNTRDEAINQGYHPCGNCQP